MLARDLAELRADHVLIVAALDGLIPALECAMPICSCPKGRGYFVKVGGHPYREKWAPSPDRYPVPGRDGGRYEPTNVRLAHMTCNVTEGMRWWNANLPPEERKRRAEWCRQVGQKTGAANLQKWRESQDPDALRAEYARRGRIAPRADRVRGGEASAAVLRKRGFFESSVWQEGAAKGRRQGGAVTGMALCQRWNINRGRPCTCGRHV